MTPAVIQGTTEHQDGRRLPKSTNVLNKKQLLILWLGVAAEIGLLLYPPWVAQLPHGLSGRREWTWLWSKPFGPAVVPEPDPKVEAGEIQQQIHNEVAEAV